LQIDNALHVQVLRLNLDQMALLAKAGGRRSGRFRTVPGGAGGKRCGGGIKGRRASDMPVRSRKPHGLPQRTRDRLWAAKIGAACENGPVGNRILVLYGSYRIDRKGIRLADYAVRKLRARGDDAELIDAKAIDLPMLDRMLKEYAPGTAPVAMESLGAKIRDADAFVFVAGEYNWGVQPGLKNLTDHFLEEWYWRPAAIASYSGGRLSGARSSYAWHNTLSEMGMVVISSTLSVGPIADTLNETGEPIGQAGAALERAFPRFADDLGWWAEAAKSQRVKRAPPY
jgi:NAD(P)H-dependent FMN reductase